MARTLITLVAAANKTGWRRGEKRREISVRTNKSRTRSQVNVLCLRAPELHWNSRKSSFCINATRESHVRFRSESLKRVPSLDRGMIINKSPRCCNVGELVSIPAKMLRSISFFFRRSFRSLFLRSERQMNGAIEMV
jgi:hypothetical protein